jgi:hypothetical protein
MTLVTAVASFAVLIILFVAAYEPWQRTWGATPMEVERPMPGDELIRHPTFNATRAVSIDGCPQQIWPWIIQIGYRRAGFYSLDWIDNDSIPSAERIIPEFQHLRAGDTIPLTGTVDAEVRVLEPNRFMLLVVDGKADAEEPWTWAWGLYPQAENRSRLVTRLRVQEDNRVSGVLMDLFEIVMTRKLMLGIKRRVESPPSSLLPGASRCADPPEDVN